MNKTCIWYWKLRETTSCVRCILVVLWIGLHLIKGEVKYGHFSIFKFFNILDKFLQKLFGCGEYQHVLWHCYIYSLGMVYEKLQTNIFVHCTHCCLIDQFNTDVKWVWATSCQKKGETYCCTWLFQHHIGRKKTLSLRPPYVTSIWLIPL